MVRGQPVWEGEAGGVGEYLPGREEWKGLLPTWLWRGEVGRMMPSFPRVNRRTDSCKNVIFTRIM